VRGSVGRSGKWIMKYKYYVKTEKYEITNPHQRISVNSHFFNEGTEIKKFIEEFVDRFKSYPNIFVTVQVNDVIYPEKL
jgi:hypothetical protein